MAEGLPVQSVTDWLQYAAHELVLDGGSYRQRQGPGINDRLDEPAPRREHHEPTLTPREVVPSP
jgi:hypothetical protein